MMRSKKSQLKLALLLSPVLIILFSCMVIILAFNVAVHSYIERLTSNEIEYEFDILDLYYGESKTDDKQNKADKDNKSKDYIFKKETDFFINVYYSILDTDYSEVLPIDSPMYSEKEAEMSKIISTYFKSHRDSIKEGKPILIKNSETNLYLKYRPYKTYDGKNIILVAYADVTFALKYTDSLHHILILLMGFSAFAVILIILVINKKIDNSFNKLKDYILSIGRREELTGTQELDYSEFCEVLSSVKEMSNMIDRANDSQKQFFQNASHELRTPLMSIQGYAEGIAGGVYKYNKKAAEVIVKQSKRMTSLVDELLLLSKMDTNAQLNIEKLDLKELLYDCTWRIKADCDKKGIMIEHQMDKESLFIMADEEKLDRALSNILTNAVRYARSKITVVCKKEADAFRIEISNDGKPVLKKDLPYIFDRFYKGEGGNFGIGLAIVYEIIKQHNGSIDVRSDDCGTCFIIILSDNL